MGLFDSLRSIGSAIYRALQKLWASLKEVVAKIIRGALNFFRNVVDRFKRMYLDPRKDNPFIIDLDNCPELREKIKNAPHVDCGIFSAVYDEETDQIKNFETVVAESFDEKTEEVLSHASEDGIVVLQ